MHLNSELLFRKYLLSYFTDNLKVLEIGPTFGQSSYQNIVNNFLIEWHTIDFETSQFIGSSVKSLTYKLKSPYSFPIKDELYDIVLSGQVIEHVAKPWIWLKELKRITKPGGYIITINPVSWPYHEAPIDCWRIYPSGIAALAEETGLLVELCLFDSLEKGQILTRDSFSKFIPGKSYNYTSDSKNIVITIRWNKFIRHIPFLKKFLNMPIEVAFDCISILRKCEK
jgi:SAM-dependent methyltransferase